MTKTSLDCKKSSSWFIGLVRNFILPSPIFVASKFSKGKIRNKKSVEEIKKTKREKHGGETLGKLGRVFRKLGAEITWNYGKFFHPQAHD